MKLKRDLTVNTLVYCVEGVVNKAIVYNGSVMRNLNLETCKDM